MSNNLPFLPFLWCWNAYKKKTIEPKSYPAMLIHLFFDSSSSSCLKKMETKKWPKVDDSLLRVVVAKLICIGKKNLCTSSKYIFGTIADIIKIVNLHYSI